MQIIWLWPILWYILSLEVHFFFFFFFLKALTCTPLLLHCTHNARKSLSMSQNSFVQLVITFTHMTTVSLIFVDTFTGFTHPNKLFSWYLNKVTDVSHFSAQWRCCISAVTVAYVEAGHCCLPKQTQLQVKSHSHSSYLHSPAASKMLTFSVFSPPFYTDWIP